MSIITIGLNHKTADIELREKLAFDKDRIVPGLKGLLELDTIAEALIVSTCNRVELYLSGSDEIESVNSACRFLAEFHNIDFEKLDNALYKHTGMEGVKHIFRVAGSLDSMVLGEPQILGQIKDAYDLALSTGSTGLILNKLMKKAISVAKRIRTETSISENAVSISYTAVELAKKIFEQLSDKNFMLLGAGEMAELAAKHLARTGVKDIMVANRTYERAVALASEFNGTPLRFEEFKNSLINTDIVICSTGASNFVLTKADMEIIVKKRKHKPMFLIDISVPRNLDPEIGDLDGVYLYDIDNLQDVVDSNMSQRLIEASKAEQIVTEEIEIFNKWMSSLDAVPTIIALRNAADQIKTDELAKLFNRLNGIGEKEKKAIEGMASGIVNKLIHNPTAALKADDEDRDMLINVVNKLYKL
ncbi:MAG: glutamyl-tRNA reductase [Nitrospirae bacterium]|nr:glutamyl-tRNA reductase [Nitrospirota bacterium]